MLGFDFRDSQGNFDFRVGDIDTLNIFDPVHAATKPATTVQDTLLHNTIEEYGIYGQDQISLLGPLQLLLGGRYDIASARSEDLPGGAINQTDDEKFSPRAGLVFAPQSFWSVYATYTESFSSANFGVGRIGQAFQPETGTQYEVGAKAETPDKSLFTTFALYELTKSNILVPDPSDTRFSVQIGEAQSRGLEWDIGGSLTPHLNLTASYAYTETDITRATDGTQGNDLYGVPRHAGKGFLRYDLEEGGERGLSFGGGVAVLSEQWGDNENTFKIPGYVRVDLMARYRWHLAGTRLTAQVNANNITDKTYYLPSGGRSEVAFGAPATVLALFRVEY